MGKGEASPDFCVKGGVEGVVIIYFVLYRAQGFASLTLGYGEKGLYCHVVEPNNVGLLERGREEVVT